MSHMLIATALAMIGITEPKPEPVKIFGDWSVGCDNERFCRAVSFAYLDDLERIPVTIWRRPGTENEAELEIDVSDFKVFRLAIDDQWLPEMRPNKKGIIRVSGSAALGLIRQMANAETIVARDPDDPPSGSFRHRWYGRVSLSGLKAALLYIDDQQKRVGTPTALVRPGRKARRNISPGYSVVVKVPPVSRKAASRISTKAQQNINLELGCEAAEIVDALPPISARLDAQNSLFVAYWPCLNGAYNIFANVLIVDNDGTGRLAQFDLPAGISGEEGDATAINAEWDASRRLLKTFYLGRGVGDCGRKRNFVWDGTMFRLAEQEEMPDCQLARRFIRTWKAQVQPQ